MLLKIIWYPPSSFFWNLALFNAQKTKFSVRDFFSKCDPVSKKLRTWSHLLKKSLMENFIFRTVSWIIHWASSQNFLKNSYSYPLIRTRTCTYQSVRNISFSENFANVLDEWPLTGIIEELRNVKIWNINIP